MRYCPEHDNKRFNLKIVGGSSQDSTKFVPH